MKAPKKVQATAEERALADVSSATWNDYVARFRPAEAALIKKAEFTAGEQASVKGQVGGDVAGAFKGLAGDTIGAGERSGAGVNSGKTKLSLAGDAAAAGKAKGVGQAIAQTGGEIDSEQQKVGIAATGRGQAHTVVANMARGAQRATGTALAESQARFQKNQAMLEAVSTVAGAAARKWGPDIGNLDGDLKEIDVTHRGSDSSLRAAGRHDPFVPNTFELGS